MFGSDKDDGKTTVVEKGAGLARGPALIMGTVLSTIGLLLFLKAGNTPTGSFPDGLQSGPKLFGVETNGWTAWFTTAAGALLLFGAAQHLLAKTMSLLVGLALGACSVIALVDGDDVLGLAAANGWTKLGWGVASGILLLNTLMPRIRHKRTVDEGRTPDRDVEPRRPPVPARERVIEREPVREERVVERQPVERTEVRRETVSERDGGFDADTRRELRPEEHVQTDDATVRQGEVTDRRVVDDTSSTGRFDRDRITDDVRDSQSDRGSISDRP